ncbi:venom allergen 5.02-like [Anabrus simplex]|uniref:venom allergen 5.02-like n=1 Tax=Anabrus simplex TaxID=316456 RepID=UPI0035A2AFCC
MLLPTLLVMLLAAISAPFSTAQNYCNICSDHTMCKYQGMGNKCQPLYLRGVDSNQRNAILNKHNELRDKVARGQETRGSPGGQPTASNMKKLTWSDELASIAQRWADQCEYQHDTCRNTETYWWVGQNIAISNSWPCDTLPNSPDWKFPMDSWYSEVKDFDKSIITKYRSTSAQTGHYTQIVWANTSEIGCGYTAFFGGQGSQKKCSQYYVCNYGMGGNIIDQEVYKIGSPRDTCRNSKEDSKYPGLCPN